IPTTPTFPVPSEVVDLDITFDSVPTDINPTLLLVGCNGALQDQTTFHADDTAVFTTTGGTGNADSYTHSLYSTKGVESASVPFLITGYTRYGAAGIMLELENNTQPEEE